MNCTISFVHFRAAYSPLTVKCRYASVDLMAVLRCH